MAFTPFNKSGLYPTVALHALGWLCLANAVGILLSLMLLIPSINQVLAPFTYGRLIPVHLNGQLYGWCFIPLLGILFAWIIGSHAKTRLAESTLEVWSIALGVGCLSWMFGLSGGKLFMEWSGVSRILISANMLYLAGVLAYYLLVVREPSALTKRLKWILWFVLLPVPLAMYWAASPALFPPVNPDSGGATGGSLLVSSLGAISIMWMTPFLLRLPTTTTVKQTLWLVVLQAFHYGAFMALDHGDQSHYLLSEIVALASLIIWVPLLILHFRRFVWPEAARIWLWSFGLWAAFLVVSANIMFAPGLLDQWKFTHFLVGHTHAAMAGMLSSFNLLVLITLNREGPLATVLGRRSLFWLWNIGVIAHVLTLKVFGVLEGAHPDWLYYRADITSTAFVLRLLSGLLMCVAGACWFLEGLKAVHAPTEHHDVSPH